MCSWKTGAASLALAALAAGCGGGAPSDGTVARDLQSALYSQEQSQNPSAGPPAMPVCSHQNGDAFVCYVNQTGYDVTDDGHNISWQPAP